MKPQAQVEYRAIADLKELPGNPRTIKKDQFEKLKTSIKDNSDYFEARPIILSDRTGELVILAGNQRYKAAKAIGLKEVPTILLPNLTDEARHIAKTTESYTLRRDMLKYIKRKERENGRQERQPSSAQRANKDRTTAHRYGWR